MSFWRIVFKSLRQHWLSTALAVVSIALGVALLVAVVSLREQAHRNFTQEGLGVARAVSEDVVTKPNGGDLGCIPKDTFGNAFAAAVSDLTPGQYSAPVESPWGVHIILREAVTVDDVSAVLKDDYVNRTIQETVAAIQRDAKVERTSPSVVPR